MQAAGDLVEDQLSDSQHILQRQWNNLPLLWGVGIGMWGFCLIPRNVIYDLYFYGSILFSIYCGLSCHASCCRLHIALVVSCTSRALPPLVLAVLNRD